MRKIYLQMLFLTVIGLIAAGKNNLLAQPSGWLYSRPIQVTDNSGTTTTQYQLRLTIDTQTPIGAGQMNSNGNDIRFTKDCAGTVMYNYWIESGINTASTVIWVKIDTLFANATRTFFMAWGNSSASAVSAVNGTFFGPHSATDSVASGGSGGATNSQRGFRFSPNEDLLVTSFGKREPNGSTRYVTLFNFTTQAIVAQNQVSGPAAQYSYGALTNPIWLTQGTQYVLELYQGATDGYYFGTSSQIGQHMTYLDMRYCNSCTQNTFPTNTLNNYHYGYPDLWYYTKRNISVAPTVNTPAYQPLSVAAGSDQSFCVGDSIQLTAIANNVVGSPIISWSPTAGLSAPNSLITYAAPTSTTTYVLTITDNSNCPSIAHDTITINVNQLPTIAATTLDDSICPGETTSLLATGTSSSYDWSPGNFNGSVYNVSPSANTTYTVVGTDVNGCVNSTTLDIVANPQPAVAVTGSYSSVCDNAVTPLFMTATGASAYSWMPVSATTDTLTDTPTASTTYYVIGTDANGCSDTASYSVTLFPSPTATSVATSATCVGVCDTLEVLATGGTPGYSYNWVPNNSTTSMLVDCSSTSMCYTVAITDMNNCMVILTNVCHNILPAPVVAATGPTTICAGDTAVLNATGSNVSTINWSPSADLNTAVGNTVIATPTVTTTYIVVGTSADGCTDTTSLELTVNPLPVVTFTSSVDTVCTTDASFTITGGSPAGGTYSGPGVSASMFYPSTAGVGSHSITYSVTSAAGCSSSASATIVVDPCTGVFEQTTQGGVTVYPNPFSTSVTIVRSTGAQAVVNVFDMNGKLVMSQTISGTRTEIETSSLANGMYSMQIVSEKGTENFRVIRN